MLISAIGAPSYVAPGLMRGLWYGKLVDMWGCGVLRVIMLSGYLAFEGRYTNEVLRKIGLCQSELLIGSWGRVSEEAKRLVGKLVHAIL